MSFIAAATRSLFPKEPPRPARRRRTDQGSALSSLIALACALAPLAAVVHAMGETA